MRRIPSTLALAGWLGFVIVSVLLPAASFQAEEASSGASEMAGSSGDVAGSLLVAALLAASSAMAFALHLIHRPDHRSGARGEAAGAIGLLIVGLTAFLAPLAGLDPYRIGEASAPFWTVLLLSVAALWFDRCVAVDKEAENDDEEFTAAVAAIAQGMARQTALYNRRPDGTPMDRIG